MADTNTAFFKEALRTLDVARGAVSHRAAQIADAHEQRRLLVREIEEIEQRRRDHLGRDWIEKGAASLDADFCSESKNLESELANLQRRLIACEAAIPVLDAGFAEADRFRAQEAETVGDAVVLWAGEEFERLDVELRTALISIAAPIAALFAVDRVRQRMLGNSFTTTMESDHPGLRSPERALRDFIASIPDRFRPADLAIPVVEREVEAKIKQMLKELGVEHAHHG